MSELVLGVDFGNGYAKIVGNGLQIVIPTGLGESIYADELGELSKELDVFEVESVKNENQKYYIGEDVGEVGKYISTNIGEGRYKNKNYKNFVESVLALALYKSDIENLEEEKHKLKVVTGVPSREKGTILEEELKQAVEGNHIVKINGEEITFTVEVLKILAQPLGTIFSYLLENDGNNSYIELKNEYVGVIDIGTGTTDIDGIEELKVVEGDRDTFDIGSYHIYQKIADAINCKNPYAKATFISVEKQFLNEEYKVSKRVYVPMKDIKETVINESIEDLLTKIQTRWQGFQKFDRIFLTGGTSNIVVKQVCKTIEGITFVENNQIANANGFYNYAKLLLK